MDIDKLINDSKNRIFWNSGGKNAVPEDSTLEDHVKFNAIPASLSLEDDQVKVLGVDMHDNHNASYIQFRDQTATLAKADDVSILVSSGFSGCQFQLWKDNDGTVVGAHVYKGKDMHADMTEAAEKAGWTHLYTWDSKGHITKAGQEGFVVAVIGDDNIDTVVLITEGGRAKKLVDWHTTYDWKKK